MVTGLRRNGASASAATAFFLGNPTLNPAVLVFLIFTLGWQWAALRLVLGVAIVLGGAALMARITGNSLRDHPHPFVLAEPTSDPVRLVARWFRALARLVLYLLPEYIVIVGLLGAARAWLFPAVGPDMGSLLLILPLFALVGALFVIPTAGEIPIIQTMMAYGLGPAPAGALLLTLAPISLPSLVMVGRVFPARGLALLFGAVVTVGIVAGLLALGLGL